MAGEAVERADTGGQKRPGSFSGGSSVRMERPERALGQGTSLRPATTHPRVCPKAPLIPANAKIHFVFRLGFCIYTQHEISPLAGFCGSFGPTGPPRCFRSASPPATRVICDPQAGIRARATRRSTRSSSLTPFGRLIVIFCFQPPTCRASEGVGLK